MKNELTVLTVIKRITFVTRGDKPYLCVLTQHSVHSVLVCDLGFINTITDNSLKENFQNLQLYQLHKVGNSVSSISPVIFPTAFHSLKFISTIPDLSRFGHQDQIKHLDPLDIPLQVFTIGNQMGWPVVSISSPMQIHLQAKSYPILESGSTVLLLLLLLMLLLCHAQATPPWILKRGGLESSV